MAWRCHCVVVWAACWRVTCPSPASALLILSLWFSGVGPFSFCLLLPQCECSRVHALSLFLCIRHPLITTMWRCLLFTLLFFAPALVGNWFFMWIRSAETLTAMIGFTNWLSWASLFGFSAARWMWDDTELSHRRDTNIQFVSLRLTWRVNDSGYT